MDKIKSAERLRSLLQYSALSNLQQLAEELDVGKQNLYDIKRGRCGISRNMRKQILARYPAISEDWLKGASDVMLAEPPAVKLSAHAHGTGKNSATIVLGSEKERIMVLETENKLLKTQLTKLEAEKDRYWEMLQKLVK